MMIQSPLNYTGGKYKLMPQLLPLFPDKIDTFVDLFCGGCNVGINTNALHYVFSDDNPYLIGLFSTMKKANKDSFIRKTDEIIEAYHLSNTTVYGYDYYSCESSSGLGSYNKNPYIHLREDFNCRKRKDMTYYVMLYVLIVYAFNNQIRFNQAGDFNLPVGKRDFNCRMRKKIENFIDFVKERDCSFECKDFRKVDVSNLGAGDFLYADPPYLITCASYNEQNGWTEQDEQDLLHLLCFLNQRGVRVALSNVLESKGKRNLILDDWTKEHPEFHINDLKYTYNNANYQRKNKESNTLEVLITNY